MNLLQLADRQLEYSDEGSGLPVVFIHGVATSGDVWAADLAELTAGARLIAYNRRGYGRSAPSPGDWRAHAQDLIQLIESLNAQPALLLGYSGGAMIALHVALWRPELVAKLILLDPAVNLKRCLTPALVRTLVTVRLLRRFRKDREAAECWLRYVSSYATGGSAFQSKASATRRAHLLANAAGMFADLSSVGGTVDEDCVRSLTTPVVIIDGRLGPRSLRLSARRLQRLLPHARTTTLENSGHWLAVDARAELLELLRMEIASVRAVTQPLSAGILHDPLMTHSDDRSHDYTG